MGEMSLRLSSFIFPWSITLRPRTLAFHSLSVRDQDFAKSRAGKGRQLNVKMEPRKLLSQLACYISELEGNFISTMFCIKSA